MKLSSILFFCLGILATFGGLALGLFMIFYTPDFYFYIKGIGASLLSVLVVFKFIPKLIASSRKEPSGFDKFIADSKPLYYFTRGVGASFLLMIVGVFGTLVFGLLYLKK